MKKSVNYKNLKTILKKLLIMLVGIFLSSCGVSFSIKSNLGATPIGVCPAVFSPAIKISTGTGLIILLSLFFVIQIIILKKAFRPFQFLQLGAMVIYGTFVDLTTKIISAFTVDEIWQQAVFSAFGIIILALGIFTMVKINFIMLPQDAVVGVISKKYNKEYGKVKIALDCVLTTIAAIGSLALYHDFIQVGIGTIANAVFVGMIISILKKFDFLNNFLSQAICET